MSKKESVVLERDSQNNFYFIDVADKFASDLVDKIIFECNDGELNSIVISLQSEKYPIQMAASYLNHELLKRGHNSRTVENGVIINNNFSKKDNIPVKTYTIDDYLK